MRQQAKASKQFVAACIKTDQSVSKKDPRRVELTNFIARNGTEWELAGVSGSLRIFQAGGAAQ